MSAELEAWLRLDAVPGLGPQGARKLLAHFGLPQHIFSASATALTKIAGPELTQRLLRNAFDAHAALEWAGRPGQRILTLADPDYPRALLDISDPPLLLYVAGDATLLSRAALAIVGSRNATAQGLLDAERFAARLSEAGYTIVSGLALGIDAAAHRGALKQRASTIAVLGTGIDVPYPARNRDLHAAIAERGALVSEYPLGTPPVAANFPRRNRLISGLARGVLVVEAAPSSGSLITARLAGEQGREVFALPGSIHSPLSKGCHALIKQGAKLVESEHDILVELGACARSAGTETDVADAAQHPLLICMAHAPCSIDELCERSGLTPDAVSAMLLTLELDGKVACLAGGRYQRTA